MRENAIAPERWQPVVPRPAPSRHAPLRVPHISAPPSPSHHANRRPPRLAHACFLRPHDVCPIEFDLRELAALTKARREKFVTLGLFASLADADAYVADLEVTAAARSRSKPRGDVIARGGGGRRPNSGYPWCAPATRGRRGRRAFEFPLSRSSRAPVRIRVATPGRRPVACSPHRRAPPRTRGSDPHHTASTQQPLFVGSGEREPKSKPKPNQPNRNRNRTAVAAQALYADPTNRTLRWKVSVCGVVLYFIHFISFHSLCYIILRLARMLRWKLAIDDDLLDDATREAEASNWLRHVLPKP